MLLVESDVEYVPADLDGSDLELVRAVIVVCQVDGHILTIRVLAVYGQLT